MSESNGEPFPTRVELMERVEAAWAELDRALVDLDAHQLSAVPSGGDWSIADHLAHLAVWTQSAIALLSGESRPEAMDVDPALWDAENTDAINAAIEERWSGRPPADVLAALRTAQASLREVISAMDDEDLGRPYSHFQPDTVPYESNPVVGWITGNTFEHVEEHLPVILAIREQVT
jgi:hypothetical protein